MQLYKSTTEKYLAKNINQEFGGQMTIGQRVADKVASLGGSWPFIFIFLLALFFWIFYQTMIARNRGFDPYPYILLNLMLSCLAALQAPIILMSQNRLAQKDRLQADHDYEINLKAEKEIEHIQGELDLARDQNLKTVKYIEEIRSLIAQINQ